MCSSIFREGSVEISELCDDFDFFRACEDEDALLEIIHDPSWPRARVVCCERT
jgi:hypothetical protein